MLQEVQFSKLNSPGGTLASDDLYLLDVKETKGEETATWTIVPVVGHTPGRRYGHTMTFTKPYLIVFGGNTGQEPVNDCWCLNVEKSPFTWTRLDCRSESPQARVYHAASLCTYGSANGMVKFARLSQRSSFSEEGRTTRSPSTTPGASEDTGTEGGTGSRPPIKTTRSFQLADISIPRFSLAALWSLSAEGPITSESNYVNLVLIV